MYKNAMFKNKSQAINILRDLQTEKWTRMTTSVGANHLNGMEGQTDKINKRDDD